MKHFDKFLIGAIGIILILLAMGLILQNRNIKKENTFLQNQIMLNEQDITEEETFEEGEEVIVVNAPQIKAPATTKKESQQVVAVQNPQPATPTPPAVSVSGDINNLLSIEAPAASYTGGNFNGTDTNGFRIDRNDNLVSFNREVGPGTMSIQSMSTVGMPMSSYILGSKVLDQIVNIGNNSAGVFYYMEDSNSAFSQDSTGIFFFRNGNEWEYGVTVGFASSELQEVINILNTI